MESVTVSRQNYMGDVLNEKKVEVAMGVLEKNKGTWFERGTADGSSQFWRQSHDG